MTARIACFGELLLRLTAPGRELLMQSGRLDVHVGGAEANVAIGLACLGHATAMVSAVPDNPLGRGAVAALRAQGVDCAGVQTRDGRMGLYFLSPGAGLRASDIVYDRAASAFAEAPADAFDWRALLAGVERLHLSGITPAIPRRSLPGSSDWPIRCSATTATYRCCWAANFRAMARIGGGKRLRRRSRRSPI